MSLDFIYMNGLRHFSIDLERNTVIFTCTILVIIIDKIILIIINAIIISSDWMKKCNGLKLKAYLMFLFQCIMYHIIEFRYLTISLNVLLHRQFRFIICATTSTVLFYTLWTGHFNDKTHVDVCIFTQLYSYLYTHNSYHKIFITIIIF